ncbi:DNA-binding response regulator [Thalassotalea loyana]|uniref:DNA-binding response regulator n=1 Tax=Thalassotalea loyana TaxID=280483 RepID=A0ABQ6HEI4_9GAMM|nr:response regulator transcription factor [Thalassotalea loyana]GLX85142.1 DNA-binding response regulator [Thalassotalea loyana]
MNVLLIEDDIDTAQFISRGVSEQGDALTHTTQAKQGILFASTTDFDVIIFDRMLPDMDGIDAIKVLRSSGIDTPILVLTALAETADRVAGLDAGADDYLVKPFAFSELQARLRALTRRSPIKQANHILSIGDLTLDRTTQQCKRAGIVLDLMPREYKILEYLLMNANQLVTKTMLLEKVWGFSFDPQTSLVQTHVSRLRNKVDKPFSSDLIKTVRGSGYVISE